MGGGPIIIIDPNKVKTNLSHEETVARLQEVLDGLQSGELAVEPAEDE